MTLKYVHTHVHIRHMYILMAEMDIDIDIQCQKLQDQQKSRTYLIKWMNCVAHARVLDAPERLKWFSSDSFVDHSMSPLI